MDFVDTFYSFVWKQLSPRFPFEFAYQASELHAIQVVGEDGKLHDIRPDDWIFASLCTLIMGG